MQTSQSKQAPWETNPNWEKEHAEKTSSLEKQLRKSQFALKKIEREKARALKAAGPLAPILPNKQDYMNSISWLFMHIVTGETDFYTDHGDDLDRLYEMWQLLYKLPNRITEEFVTDNEFSMQ